MNVSIAIHYISAGGKIMQRGSFPLKRRKPEEVALEWLMQIRREMPYGAELVKVIANEEDITDLVMDLEKKSYNLDLPF